MSSGLLQRVSALKDMISSDASDGVSGSLDRLSAFEQARALISGLDGASSIVNILGIPRWTSLVGVLQKIAYLDPDSGGERDIALWCERQWATVLQEHPQNIAALQGKRAPTSPILGVWRSHSAGLGHAWLLKSQQMLARIHSSGGSLSSEGGSSPTRHRSSRWRHLSQVANGDEDAARINSPNYIEARDLLRPSLDSFARAVSAADAQGVVAGELLELVS